MENDMELTDRKKQILKIVTEEYIRSAEPIGSKAIVERMPDKISSATIRNELADLVEMGYLEQPHTSAGRVPSAKGYRLYVNELMERRTVSGEEAEKISSALGKVDYVIINAAECEPYITGDHRTCLERPDQVIKGATVLAKCFGLDKVYIGIEANKQNAADVLNEKIKELNAPVVVEVLHTRYPQGAEKQLVQAVSGRQVPSGKLPADAGCCIFNLNTTCAIYRAVYEGMPVVSKIVTVSGSGVIEPKNIECPIGTPISKLFDACGGLKDDTYKLIMGGPMMGLAQYSVDVSVGKGTGAMLAFAGDEEKYEENPQCIRCGKCVGVCPIRLEPVFMYKYLMKGDVDTWQNVLHGMDCIECGACTYTCPARLPLTHAFRLGKQQVNNARMAAKAKAEAEKAAAEKKEA